MKLERVIKLERRFSNEVHNVYENAARFRWSHTFTNESIVKNIYENEEYRALPRYSQTQIAGVLWHCRLLHDKLMVFSYEIDGIRMMITEERYRKVSPQRVHEEFSDTGAYVYKEDPSVIWYSGKQGSERTVSQ